MQYIVRDLDNCCDTLYYTRDQYCAWPSWKGELQAQRALLRRDVNCEACSNDFNLHSFLTFSPEIWINISDNYKNHEWKPRKIEWKWRFCLNNEIHSACRDAKRHGAFSPLPRAKGTGNPLVIMESRSMTRIISN